MEKLFYLILLALFTTGLFAQRSLKHCSFEPSPQQIERMNGYREAIARFGNGTRVELRAPIRIPVRAVLFSSTRTSSSLSQLDFERAVQGLNRTFATANLEFFACDTLRRVISSRYADFDSDFEESNVWKNYGQAGVVNIFCFEDIDFGSVYGYTYLPDDDGPEAIFLLKEALLTSTLPHEMGHYFGLYHTHGKSNCGTTDELVNDPNCQRTGDDVCDTPADPNLFGLFCSEDLVDSASCTYIGTETDRLGNLFEPDPSNIMAYTWDHCTTRFTLGQYERMRFFAENVRLYADDCSGRKVCPVPNVVGRQLSPGVVQFEWVSGPSNFQARYRLGEDTTWIELRTIYGNKWLAYDLAPCTQVEFQVRASCGAAFTDWSAPVVAFTKGCTSSDYCPSPGGSESVWIKQLSLGTWTQESGDDGGYAVFAPNDLSISAGKSYALGLTPGGFIRAKDTLYWRLWIDLNQDKDFDDPGEQLFQAKSRSRVSTTQGNLTIPSAVVGTYRLRVSLSKGGFVDACGKGGTVLETEDYVGEIQKVVAYPIVAKKPSSDVDLAQKDRTPQFQHLNVFPNPNKGLFYLQLADPGPGEGKLSIYNSRGQLLQHAQLNLSVDTPLQVNLSAQPAGVYFLRLQIGAQLFSERLILLNP